MVRIDPETTEQIHVGRFAQTRDDRLLHRWVVGLETRNPSLHQRHHLLLFGALIGLRLEKRDGWGFRMPQPIAQGRAQQLKGWTQMRERIV